MKITSLNLQGYFDWDRRESAILAHLEAQQPDVVLFQEVVYLPEVAAVPQPTLLNRVLGYPWRHEVVSRQQHSAEFGLYREGLAVLSRFPLPTSTTIVLPQETGDPHERIVQLVDVVEPDSGASAGAPDAAGPDAGGPAGGGTVWRFANAHLSIREEFALPQLRALLRMFEARGERRCIVGDFNMEHLERHRRLWSAHYELSSERFPVDTFPGGDGEPGKGIDYLLVPREQRLTALTASGIGLSDHLAITATLETQT